MGCHGIILSATQLGIASDLKILKVTPGIRPDWWQDNRHEKKVALTSAIVGMADILVRVSPIWKDEDSIWVLKKSLPKRRRQRTKMG